MSASVKPLTANFAALYALCGVFGPSDAQKPLTELVFKRDRLVEDYRRILNPSEDMDIHANMGEYSVSPTFNLLIVSNLTKESEYLIP